MALADAIRRVIKENDSTGAANIANFCRYDMGMNYNEILERVQKECPEVTQADWDGLLYEHEQKEGRGY